MKNMVMIVMCVGTASFGERLIEKAKYHQSEKEMSSAV